MKTLITILAVITIFLDPTFGLAQFKGGNPGNFCFQETNENLKELKTRFKSEIFPSDLTREYIAYLNSNSIFFDVEDLKEKIILMKANGTEETCVLVDCKYLNEKPPSDVGFALANTLVFDLIRFSKEDPIKRALSSSRAKTEIIKNCQMDF